MKLLITGCSGFVGGALSGRLAFDSGVRLMCVGRRTISSLPATVSQRVIPDLCGEMDWSDALCETDTVVHCAARAHVTSEVAHSSEAEFQRVNVDATINLARQAAEANVRRFVFVSSIKVNGDVSITERPFSPLDRPAPSDAYARSKYEAEKELWRLGRDTGMEIVIVRPPLVYGPGVKANFRTMMSCLYKGIPLPLGMAHNLRSFVALDNLIDLLVTCIQHPAAANQVFLVSDGNDLSTRELLTRVGEALGRPARLLPLPLSILEVGAKLLGQRTLAQRLCSSLQVDISKTQELLDWRPPVSVDEALAVTARAYLDAIRS